MSMETEYQVLLNHQLLSGGEFEGSTGGEKLNTGHNRWS
jgi:hypothetical protein